jgi:hypothetical protein
VRRGETHSIHVEKRRTPIALVSDDAEPLIGTWSKYAVAAYGW